MCAAVVRDDAHPPINFTMDTYKEVDAAGRGYYSNSLKSLDC